MLAVTIAAAVVPVASAHAAITVSPLDGTPAASPQTQISILGTKPSAIVSVTVSGKISGRHTGKLKPYSGNRGASFVLDDSFTQGEKVTATIKVRGAKKAIRTRFAIARLGITQPVLKLNILQTAKLDTYASEPELQSPKITVNKRSSRASDGDIFLTPLPSPVVQPGADNAVSIHPVGPGGPMIIDKDGKLVWFRKLANPDVAANLQIQRYRGRDVLTWWEGPVTPSAFGLGRGIVADSSYRTLATVRAGNGYPMDIHEFRIVDGTDAIFTIYSPILIPVGGKLIPMLNSIVQQVDIRTGLVVWEWHSYGHVPLSESYASPRNSSQYDAFHINSIQGLPGNRVLLSMRDTSAVYLVDRTTGKIDWTLGGKKSDFKLGTGARFWFQHDVQQLPDGRIGMFDDQAGPPQKAPASRGLILKLDHKRMTAKVDAEYKRAADTSAQSEGSLQLLDNGNVFVGFGAQPYFSEFTADGKLLFDASLPVDDGSYRVYRHAWKAKPTTKPKAAAVRGADGSVTVHASWNGATEVASWEVVGDGGGVVAGASRTGFETAIAAGASSTYAVRALDAKGKTLGTSAPVAAP